MTNISNVQNIAFKLRQLNQNVDENMIMTKITTILPEDYKHFSTAWDSTVTVDRTLDNLVARLMLEEVKCKYNLSFFSSAYSVLTEEWNLK